MNHSQGDLNQITPADQLLVQEINSLTRYSFLLQLIQVIFLHRSFKLFFTSRHPRIQTCRLIPIFLALLYLPYYNSFQLFRAQYSFPLVPMYSFPLSFSLNLEFINVQTTLFSSFCLFFYYYFHQLEVQFEVQLKVQKVPFQNS